MRPLASSSVVAALRTAGRRTFATHRSALTPSVAKEAPRPIRAAFPRHVFQQTFRRAYADAAPEKPKKKGFRFLRWTWRLSILSALGGLGYISYGIYQMRNPADQPEPDPKKKTLVILGMLSHVNPTRP